MGNIVTKIQFSTDLQPINHYALNTFYSHLIAANGIYLYYQINNVCQLLQRFPNNNCLLLEDFLAQLNWTEQQLHQTREKLEQVGLLKTKLQTNLEEKRLFFQLVKPISLEQVLTKQSLNNLLSKEKQQQVSSWISALTNYHHDYHEEQYDITSCVDDQFLKTPHNQKLLSANQRAEFYGLIYDDFGQVFSVEELVYDQVYFYSQRQQLLSLKTLAKFGYDSLIKTDLGYQINLDKFQNKIQEQLTKQKYGESDYYSFWCKLIHYDEATLTQKYHQLFTAISPESLSFLLTKNRKISQKLSKWINHCLAANFPVGTVNLMLSFTKAWIKSLNVNYLQKISETCGENKNDLTEIFSHFRAVITNDMENKNRLKLTNQKPPKATNNPPQEEITNDQTDFENWFFS